MDEDNNNNDSYNDDPQMMDDLSYPYFEPSEQLTNPLEPITTMKSNIPTLVGLCFSYLANK